VPTDTRTSWAEIQRKASERVSEIQKKTVETIRQGEKDEVNPWLERTQWAKYLAGFERPELMACVEEPGADNTQGGAFRRHSIVSQQQNAVSRQQSIIGQQQNTASYRNRQAQWDKNQQRTRDEEGNTD